MTIAKTGVKGDTNVIFVYTWIRNSERPDFAKTLTKVLQRKNIHFKPFYAISKIDVANKEDTSPTRSLVRTIV